MAGETTITLVGNLTADPELRFTPSGAAVANFTVASTPRTFDRQTNEWRDGDAMFLNCAVWRQAAENVAESLQKGMRVIVQGRALGTGPLTFSWSSLDGGALPADIHSPLLVFDSFQRPNLGRYQLQDSGPGGTASAIIDLRLATNDDWLSATNPNETETAAAMVGAFALPSGSGDAALALDPPCGELHRARFIGRRFRGRGARGDLPRPIAVGASGI